MFLLTLRIVEMTTNLKDRERESIFKDLEHFLESLFCSTGIHKTKFYLNVGSNL